MRIFLRLLIILFLNLSISCGTEVEKTPPSVPVVDPDHEPDPVPEPSLLFEHLDGRPLTESKMSMLDLSVSDSSVQPYAGHPRLYGNNEAFFRKLKVIEDFDTACTIPGVTKGLGRLPNFKRMWQARMIGGEDCENTINGDLTKHIDANRYLSGQVNSADWPDNGTRLRVLHLLRREVYCQDSTVPCRFRRSDIENLTRVFLNTEISRLKNAPRAQQAPLYADEMTLPQGYMFNRHWHKANDNRFMVLDAALPFKFWTLVLDVFHNQAPLPQAFRSMLSQSDRLYIEQQLEHEVDSYLLQYKHKHWSLFNGNNWTVMLNSAALHWAILNYYEKPEKARDVLSSVLKTNWLHRDYYQQDGGYLEGGSYALSTSYPYVLMMHKLLMSSFSQPNHSFKWLRGGQMAQWFMDSYASDSYLIDFGDTHSQQGMSSSAMLDLLMVEQLLKSDVSAQSNISAKDLLPDSSKACEFKRYFSNIYYDVIFDDPWNISAFYFNDWQAIIDQCDENQARNYSRIYPDLGLAFSQFQRTNQAEHSLFQLNYQKNQLFMTTTATDTPHREMDISGIIWSAYGNRLLSDFGYGRIVRNYYEYDLFTNFGNRFDSHVDHVLGSNTLVLPEAFSQRTDTNNHFRFEYTGQGFAGTAELEQQDIDGHTAIVMDATDAYGAAKPGKFTRPAVAARLGHYSRTLLAIDDHFLVIDSIAAQAGKTTQAEDYFYTNYRDRAVNADQPCQYPVSRHVDVSLHNAEQNKHPAYIALVPECSQLERGKPSQVKGRIYGYGLKPGHFNDNHPSYLQGVEPFSSDALQQGDHGEKLIEMTNVLNKRLKRQLVRWKSDAPFERDIRLFVLQATRETDSTAIPEASSVQISNCEYFSSDICLSVRLAEREHRLMFSLKTLASGTQYFQLEKIHNPE